MQSVSLTEEQKSASIPTEGDLGNLDFRPRISLALLLDPTSVDKDWKALAERLNLSHLIGGLQSMTSPTKELLNLYEVKATMDTTSVYREKKHPYDCFTNLSKDKRISMTALWCPAFGNHG